MLLTLLLLVLLVLVRATERQFFDGSGSPAELAKLAVVIYIGHWLASKGELLRKLPYGLLPFTIMVGMVAGLVVANKDISEAIIIVLIAGAMFFLAGADLVQFLIGMAGGLAAFVLVVRQMETVRERIGPFIASWQHPLESTNQQLTQGLIAMGSGGLFGLGPGSGRMKYRWLPVPHTDSIFAIAGEELGLVGCLVLVALFALVAYRGLRIASQSPDAFGGLLAAGITCWLGFQALINLGVVTGTIPFSGTALPFVSLGGSSLITCMIGVGIMLSVSRTVNRKGAP
jgi:cell division protein FtsW